MKKITKILSLLLALVFAMTAFVACGGETVIIEEGGIDYVQVQWVWGQVVLREEYVEKGSYLTPWTPEVEGREFEGWYEIPEKIKTFKFEKTPITEPMRIYASFKGGPVDIETEMPDWYLIGTGKGDLSKSGWDHNRSAQYLGLKADETGIYKITLELYAGDAFKMTRDLVWTDEKAIDKMAGFADGSVKDASGNVVFTAGQNNNIVVAEGMNGKYEITFDPNTETMGFTLIEQLGEKPDDIRLIGTFKGNFSTAYEGDEYKFSTTDNITWTYEWVVDAEYKFKVYNNISGRYYPDGTDNDLVIQPGKYTITFNLKTESIVVTDENGNTVDVGATGGNGGGTGTGVDEIRVVGDFNGWADGATSDWNLTKGADGVWTGTFTFDTQVELKLYNVGNGQWFAPASNGAGEFGNLTLPAGTYNFKCASNASTFVYWPQGGAEPETPAGGTTGGNTGSSDVPTGSLPEGEGTLVFFVNDWNWTDVKCYTWDSNNTEHTAWSGTAMTKVGTTITSNGERDVYAFRVPVGTAGIIFNGNDNGTFKQSPDIKTGIVDGAAWMMSWNETAGEHIVTAEYTYAP